MTRGLAPPLTTYPPRNKSGAIARPTPTACTGCPPQRARHVPQQRALNCVPWCPQQRALNSVPSTACPPPCALHSVPSLVREPLGPLGSRPLTQLTPCTCLPAARTVSCFSLPLPLPPLPWSSTLAVASPAPYAAQRSRSPGISVSSLAPLRTSRRTTRNPQCRLQVHRCPSSGPPRRPPLPAQAAGEATFRLSTPALSIPAATLGLAP